MKRYDFNFRRGGQGSSAESSQAPDNKHFVKVPETFLEGLSEEKWKALQAVYRQAWEAAQRELSGGSEPGYSGAGNYEI